MTSEAYGMRDFENSVEPSQSKILRPTPNSMHVKSWIGVKGEKIATQRGFLKTSQIFFTKNLNLRS